MVKRSGAMAVTAWYGGGTTGRRVWRIGVLVALVAAFVAVPLPPAEAVQRPQTLYHERQVGTGPVEPGFPIDSVGVVFDLSEGADVHHDHAGDAHAGVEGVEVRFRTGDRWGPWQRVGEDGAQQVGQWTGALVPAGDAEAYQVRGLPEFAANVPRRSTPPTARRRSWGTAPPEPPRRSLPASHARTGVPTRPCAPRNARTPTCS